jgi:L-glutamine:2-deoxy-scyllo-inosose/3-amino-2,3-dideoxy-scyllo-inosose aminotransferase
VNSHRRKVSLALNGGPRLRTKKWPDWPQVREHTLEAVLSATKSGRWTLSGPWVGHRPLEQEFADRFASLHGVRYCVPTDHGSSSLVIALEAIGVGAGDEVIVPVLTWVATATAVLNVNAIPVFADVDAANGCLSRQGVEQAITDRTKAIIPVHLHCSMANMDDILDIARKQSLTIIEDCAQAHGARWRGQLAGSIGDLGAFSMQQTKVLTCGEGGAVITRNHDLYRRLQQLRADSREYSRSEPAVGQMQLEETASVMGANHCLSEFHAGVLLEQLDHLEDQLAVREQNARFLDENLGTVPGVNALRHPPGLERQSVYEYAVARTPEAFGGKPTRTVCAALQAELGCNVYQADAPLHRNKLYCPWTKPRYLLSEHHQNRLDYRGRKFPMAEKLHRSLILLHHANLLGDQSDMEDVVDAFEKVSRHSEEL